MSAACGCLRCVTRGEVFSNEGLQQMIEDFDLLTVIYNNNTMPFFSVYATPR